MPIEFAQSWRQFADGRRAAIFGFAGRMGMGSDGNDEAHQIDGFVQSVVSTSRPDAIVLDFSKLGYHFENGIWQVAERIYFEKIPTCVIAEGETAGSLGPFLMMGHPRPMLVFSNMESAVTYLEGEFPPREKAKKKDE